MNFLYIYLGEERGEMALMHVLIFCMGTQSAFTTEPLNRCLRNLVGMKYLWPAHALSCFGHIRPGADPG